MSVCHRKSQASAPAGLCPVDEIVRFSTVEEALAGEMLVSVIGSEPTRWLPVMFPSGKASGGWFTAPGVSASLKPDRLLGLRILKCFAAARGLTLQLAAREAARLLGVDCSLAARLLYQGPRQWEPVLNEHPPSNDVYSNPILNHYGYQLGPAYGYLGPCGKFLGAMAYFESSAGDVIPLGMTLRRSETGQVNLECLYFTQPYPLYNQEFLELDKQADALVVENEAMAELLLSDYRGLLRGAIPTTWPGGALTVGNVDLSPLHGRNVILMSHNSSDGLKTSHRLTKLLKQAGVKSVRFVARSAPPAEAYRAVARVVADDALTDDLYQAFRQDRLLSPSEFVAYAETHAGVRLESQRQALPALTIGEFIEKPCEETTWILFPLIRKGERVMIYACAGLGKTWLVLFIIECLGSGGEMLGGRWKSPRALRVLLIDGENGEGLLQERFRAVFGSGDARTNVRVLSAAANGAPLPDLSTKEGQAAIEPHLAKTDVVVIDNINALARGALGADPESCAQFNAWINELSTRGVTVIVLNHASRGGDSFGSSTKEFGLDLIIQLKRPKGYKSEQGARFVMEFQKTRNLSGADIVSLPVAVEHADGRAKLTCVSSEEANREDRDKEIARLTTENMPVREIAELVGLSSSAVNRRQAKLKLRRGDSAASAEAANDGQATQPDAAPQPAKRSSDKIA